MLDAKFIEWRRWPLLLKRSAAGLSTATLLALLYLLLAGTPQPIAPASALFAEISVEQDLLASRPELSSSDFSLRPVFAVKRVPPPPLVIDVEQDEKIDEIGAEEVLGSIDGASLLGTFGSGEVAGVIIRLDNGDKQRLSVGESVKGWTLQSLGPRRAMLQSSAGQPAVLEMAFATDQVQLSAVERVPSSESARSGPEGEDSVMMERGPTSDVAAEAKSVPQRVSFDNIYGGAPKQDAKGQK
ncbi:MAG: hypothetical protein P8M13_05340 [Luminiphilus sp.]|nr:hypothetical protein [Luminiphilus sp.]